MSNKLGLNYKQAWTGFFLAYDKLTKEIDRRMRDAGVVSLDVYDVLLILEISPDRKMKMSDLANEVLRSMSGATRAAERLEKEGLIVREASKEDRRVVYAHITDKGVAERVRAWPVYELGIKELFADQMTVAEAVNLAAIFGRIRPLPDYLSS